MEHVTFGYCRATRVLKEEGVGIVWVASSSYGPDVLSPYHRSVFFAGQYGWQGVVSRFPVASSVCMRYMWLFIFVQHSHVRHVRVAVKGRLDLAHLELQQVGNMVQVA